MRTTCWGRLAVGLLAVGALLPAKAIMAQEPAQQKPRKDPESVIVYRFEFVVRELEDGKRIDSRSYMVSGRSGETAQIRVGTRVPVSTGGANFTYENVGINIDCRPQEIESSVLLGTHFEASSVIAASEAGMPPEHPVFRHVTASFASIVQPGKPTVIGMLDDVTTKRRYEIEVTATKVK